jgi:cytoskeleton protein RodZ
MNSRRLPDRIRRHRAKFGATATQLPAIQNQVAAPEPIPESPQPPDVKPAVTGVAQLAEVRVARGLGIDEVARRLHVPTAVLRELESGELTASGAPVFVRGLLRSYARLLELPADTGFDVAAGGRSQPELVAALPALRPNPLLRFVNPAAYAMLTAAVLVPVLYFAAPQRSADAPPVTLAPIDADSVVLAPKSSVNNVGPADVSTAVESQAAIETGPPAPPLMADSLVPVAPAPMMASMAPVGERTPPEAASQQVVIALSVESWVDFAGVDGRRHEYALLPAGTRRSYSLDGSARLVIGDARGASVSVAGRRVDLRPYTRANRAELVLEPR